MENNNSTLNILKGSWVLHLKSLMSLLVGLFSTKIVIDNLSVEEYGLFALLFGIVNLFAVFQGVMLATTNKFMAYSITNGTKKSTTEEFSGIVSISIVLSLLALIISETLGIYFISNHLKFGSDLVHYTKPLWRLLSIAAIADIFFAPFKSYLLVTYKFQPIGFTGIIQIIGKIIMMILMVNCDMNNLFLYAWVLLLIRTLSGIWFVYSVSKVSQWYFLPRTLKPSLLKYINYMSSISFGLLVNKGFNSLLQIMINRHSGLTVNAAIGLINTVISILRTVRDDLSQVLNNILFRTVDGVNHNKLNVRFLSNSRYILFLVLSSVLPLIMFGERIFPLLLENVPYHTHRYLPPLLLLFLIKSLIAQTEVLVETSNRVFRFKLIQAVLSGLILFVVSSSLKYNMKIELVLYQMLFGFIMSHIFALNYLKLNLRLRTIVYFRNVYAPLFLIGSLSLLACLLVKELRIEFILSMVICIIFNVALCMKFILTSEERLTLIIALKKYDLRKITRSSW